MDYKKLEGLIRRCIPNTELEAEDIHIPLTCNMWYDKKTGDIHSFNSSNHDVGNKDIVSVYLKYDDLPQPLHLTFPSKNIKSGPLPELSEFYLNPKNLNESERKYLDIALNHIQKYYSKKFSEK